MDCNSARLLLQFVRIDGPDLDGPEAGELDTHLAGCCDCSALAQNHRRLDDHLGRAMRAVEVPTGLREQIFHRLAADRSDRQRHWQAIGLRVSGIAAAVLLILWGWYAFYTPPPPIVYAESVGQTYNISRLDAEGGDAELRKLRGGGSLNIAPTFVRYEYLVGSPALAVLPGVHESKGPVKVPQLVFVHQKDRGRTNVAWVYIVPNSQYRVEEPSNSDHGYEFRTDIRKSPRNDFTYLIMYQGDHWQSWLAAPVRD